MHPSFRVRHVGPDRNGEGLDGGSLFSVGVSRSALQAHIANRGVTLRPCLAPAISSAVHCFATDHAITMDAVACAGKAPVADRGESETLRPSNACKLDRYVDDAALRDGYGLDNYGQVVSVQSVDCLVFALEISLKLENFFPLDDRQARHWMAFRSAT